MTVIMPHDSQGQSQHDSLISFYVKLSWQRHLKQSYFHSKCHYWAKDT